MALFRRKAREPEEYDPATGMVIHRNVAEANAKALELAGDLPVLVHTWGWPVYGAHGALYRRQPAVRTVVDFLSHNVGSLNLKAFLRADNADREEIDNHPVVELLRKPNPSTTRYRFMRDTVADMAIEDVAFWRKIRQGARVVGLVRIPVSKITIDTTSSTTRYRLSQTGETISPADLVIFPGYSPDGDTWGVSPMETLLFTLQEEWNSQQHRQYFWKNAARRDGVIIRPLDAPVWSGEAKQRFRQDWEATHTGAMNAGRTPILEDGMTWEPDAFSPKDSEYIEGRRLAFEEVCRAYSMSPKLFGVGDTTNANIESFHRQLYQDTLGPTLRQIQDEIELQLLPEVDNTPASLGRIYIEFNLSEKLKASFEEEARTIATAVGVPYLSVNEGRARQNLPRLEGEEFDIPVQPLNVLYGGQPAETVPNADPSTPPQAGNETAPDQLPAAAHVPLELVRSKAEVPAQVIRRREIAVARMQKQMSRYMRTFKRAHTSVTGKSDSKAFDLDYWNRKLHALMYSEATPLVQQNGERAAKQFGTSFDMDVTLNYLDETTRRSAKNINQTTVDELDEAEDEEAVAAVYDRATGSRSAQLAASFVTTMVGFARTEAAKQAEREDPQTQRTKTWVVTSANSRHPEMDGETVGVEEDFSNGMPWPGSSLGDVDEIAGCQCLLELN